MNVEQKLKQCDHQGDYSDLVMMVVDKLAGILQLI